MRKTNLLYVITKLELGGAQKQLLSLISHLDKEKFQPFLFTAAEGLLMQDAESLKGLTITKSRYLERAINPFKDFFTLIELCRFIKNNKIEIVHTHSAKAGILGRIAARLARAKIIFHTVHGWPFHDFQPVFLRRIFIWLEKVCAKFTDKIIVVCNADKEKGLRNRIGDTEKYCLIRYGIDYEQFNVKEELKAKGLNVAENELVIGTLSCLKPQKSPQDFIKLAYLVNKALSNVKFVLVGDGELRKELERLIQRYDLQKKVILAGWRRDIPQILQAIDVFVLTSLWEGLPIAMLEAMSVSKPVVITRTGGTEELIQDGKNGFLVQPKDMNSMSEKLLLLLKDKKIRDEMGSNARQSLNFDFTTENMVENTQRLYEFS